MLEGNILGNHSYGRDRGREQGIVEEGGGAVPRKTSAENSSSEGPYLTGDLGSPGCSLVQTTSRRSQDVTSPRDSFCQPTNAQ